MTDASDPAEPLKRRWLKILCAVDFSECSREALELAADLARRLDAELTILHVREPAASRESVLGSARRPEEEEREIERSLARCKLDAQQYMDGPIRAVVVSGSPAPEILELTAEGEFDLVVTGTHGRSGVRRVVLGSVAERVVRQAPCPVLVARTPPAEPTNEARPLRADDGATDATT